MLLLHHDYLILLYQLLLVIVMMRSSRCRRAHVPPNLPRLAAVAHHRRCCISTSTRGTSCCCDPRDAPTLDVDSLLDGGSLLIVLLMLIQYDAICRCREWKRRVRRIVERLADHLALRS